MASKVKQLPRKPSRLIRATLKDLKEREIDARYVIDMSCWHDPNTGVSGTRSDRCSICFAGAAMGRLGVGPDSETDPEKFGEPNTSRLRALDDFRCGSVVDALARLGINHPKGLRYSYRIPDYRLNAPAFHKKMNWLADRLEKAGL